MTELWQEWRARRLDGRTDEPMPDPPGRDDEGGWIGAAGKTDPGTTGEAVCHLVMIGQAGSGPAVVACDWLEEVRTPAGAWLAVLADAPPDVEGTAGPRVWATASASLALLATGRDPGDRALMLLHGESDQHGAFTGGLRPTAAAAGAFWLARGPKSELAEWGLRWARENVSEWGPAELTSALVSWAAAGIPADHVSVIEFCEALRAELEAAGGELNEDMRLRALEALHVLD